MTPADGVYKFPGAETGLLPDVGFYAWDRHPGHRPSPRPIPFAPDLAVEVASPNQRRNEMAAKARVYLRGGTRLVWMIWPGRQQIDVWRQEQTSGPIATLGSGDLLDGEDIIPGFTYPVADVFADPLD